MMTNSTQVSHFTLVAYVESGVLRYLYFVLLLCLYAFIICANVLLVAVICAHRSLHEPMFVFLCSLLVNELYGSTGLFPFLLLQVLSDVHVVSAPLCYVQIFCLYTYVNVEFYNLAVMSYDRYLAICFPLQYNTRMTSSKVALLIAAAWVFPLLAILVMISLNASLRLCSSVIERLYCDNYSVVKLACSDTTANNVYGLLYTFTVLVGLTAFNLFTYMRILRVCLSGGKQTREKALNTCTPHLASLINFSCGCILEVLQSRLDLRHLSNGLRICLSLYFLIFQPIFSPLLYGLNMKKIRSTCRSLLCRQIRLPDTGGCHDVSKF